MKTLPDGANDVAASAQGATTILVIDDEPDLLRMLEVVLTGAGYTVLTAPSGMEGLVRAQAEQPQLVLLDIMMEGMDGWEVLKLLKLEESTRGIPVVILSARVEPRDKIRGLQEGAVDYVTKPFSVKRVLGTIDAILPRAPS
ncbi:MAG TPA: response regulator [Thermoanaerobaculia bacterium]|nr:response regulator [Thermoanaerobaculia bacterium]